MTNQDEIVISPSIDQMLQNLPIGSVSRAIGNNLYGINFRQTGNITPKPRDTYGFTFFTRPQLNLHRFNITNYRGFNNLMTSNSQSYQRFVRMMLDPRLLEEERLHCPFVDNDNAFISTLTNNIVSMSGFPDLVAPTYTSDAGVYGEEHSIVDGVTNHFEGYDVDVTFKNMKGNPLLYMFYVWIKYQTLVFEGILVPYTDMITENEIDYNTRIYRLVMDQNKRYISYIGCTGASFPINVPTGNLFDYSIDTPYNTKNSEINIRFRSMGFRAFEDLIKYEFNLTSAIFNSDIAALLKHDENGKDSVVARENPNITHKVSGCNLIKVPHLLSAVSDDLITETNNFYSVNHRAYPYINLVTNELEWWTRDANSPKATREQFEKELNEKSITQRQAEADAEIEETGEEPEEGF